MMPGVLTDISRVHGEDKGSTGRRYRSPKESDPLSPASLVVGGGGTASFLAYLTTTES